MAKKWLILVLVISLAFLGIGLVQLRKQMLKEEEEKKKKKKKKNNDNETGNDVIPDVISDVIPDVISDVIPDITPDTIIDDFIPDLLPDVDVLPDDVDVLPDDILVPTDGEDEEEEDEEPIIELEPVTTGRYYLETQWNNNPQKVAAYPVTTKIMTGYRYTETHPTAFTYDANSHQLSFQDENGVQQYVIARSSGKRTSLGWSPTLSSEDKWTITRVNTDDPEEVVIQDMTSTTGREWAYVTTSKSSEIQARTPDAAIVSEGIQESILFRLIPL